MGSANRPRVTTLSKISREGVVQNASTYHRSGALGFGMNPYGARNELSLFVVWELPRYHQHCKKSWKLDAQTHNCKASHAALDPAARVGAKIPAERTRHHVADGFRVHCCCGRGTVQTEPRGEQNRWRNERLCCFACCIPFHRLFGPRSLTDARHLHCSG